MTQPNGRTTFERSFDRSAACQVLANFMLTTSLHYIQLTELRQLSPPHVSEDTYDSYMDELVKEDSRLITNYIRSLGAIDVDYIDPFDNEHMLGRFVGCQGFNGQEGCWVMSFTGVQKYQNGVNAHIYPAQLPSAMKLSE